MKKNIRLLNFLMIAALFLGACNLPSGNDEGFVGTAAAETLAAVLSATPTPGGANTPSFTPLFTPTLTPTPTPLNTNTPIPTATSNCNNMNFIADVTIPDGTIMSPSQAFTKTWRIQNTGTCTWSPSYAVVFSSGNSMNGPAAQSLTGNVSPGQTVDIPVNLTAPASPGDYESHWRLRDGSGVLFGAFFVKIKVQNPVTATFTLPPAAIFAVTSVTYSVSSWSSGGNVNCPRIIANITTSSAGTITYTWTTTSGTNPPQTLVFGSAGTQSINYDWARGSVWAGTPDSVGIYINAPNHQDFGQQTFTTACTTP